MLSEITRFGLASASSVLQYGASRAVRNPELAETLGRMDRHGERDTADHSRRIGQYAILLAEHLGLNQDMQKQVYGAGLLHDIGKLAVPRSILQKPGRLGHGERKLMNDHTLAGAAMLAGAGSPALKAAAKVALHHHERWDGSGYPHGLSGTAIPLPARIVAVCDVYDALRSPRPYKGAISHRATLNTIRDGDGRTRPEHFDPAVVDAFLQINRWFEAVYAGGLDA